jgi:putative DNA primase/helicase
MNDQAPFTTRRFSPEPPKKPSKRVNIIMGSNVKLKAIDWLWPDWLAYGKLHILAGRPGSLKTTAALSFGGSVSAGGQWPDGSPAPQGNVVIWSGEDAIDDTLAPRFAAAGGNLARVAFISGVEEDGKKRGFDPACDMEELGKMCAELGQVSVIIIDPLVATSKGDSHKNAETRRDLQPLVDLGERTQAVVIGIHHLTKRSEDADPLDRVSGSLAYGAAPRAVLFSALNKNVVGETRGVLIRVKNSNGPPHGGFEFSGEIRPLDDHPNIAAQRILWGSYLNEPARDILAKLEGKDKAELGARKAATFLREALRDGPQMAAEIIAQGKAAGCSERVLQRALKRIGGSSEKAGLRSGWIWDLPREPAEEDAGPGWDS